MSRRPSKIKLEEARLEFCTLLNNDAKESQFQSLFSRCPFILSDALPLKLEPSDIVSLGRPGRSEPDFVFYPKSGSLTRSYGVIELKRPTSKILTRPRADTIILTRNAQTAISQSQNYASRLERQLYERIDQALFLGTSKYTFVIMGLTEELADEAYRSILHLQGQKLIPPSCQIIPYDDLYRRFTELNFRPLMILAHKSQENVLALVSEVYHSVQRKSGRRDLSDSNIRFWKNLEVIWDTISNASSTRFEIEDFYVVGTDVLALETPNPTIFGQRINSFAREIVQNTSRSVSNILERRLNAKERIASVRMDELSSFLTDGEYRVIKEAVNRCRKDNRNWTWLDRWSDEDAIQFLEDVDWANFLNADSGEAYYQIDEFLLRQWYP